MKGRRATGHWATQGHRETRYPETRWLKNVRYVDDGAVISSAGVSAALPTSLALVEAIAGGDRARQLAHELGVDRWDSAHASDGFRLRAKDIAVYARNRWLARQELVELSVEPGVDEIALALTADALGRTMRVRLDAASSDGRAVRSRGGLVILPQAVPRTGASSDAAVPWSLAPRPAAQALDDTLAAIARRYGDATAEFVRLQLEYPAAAR